MKKVFADTLNWVAVVLPRDQWKSPAQMARKALGDVCLVTTDEVLGEFLAVLRQGSHLREKAVQMVRAILKNPNVNVIPQTRMSFLAGLERYASRKDKTYTLTDCISTNVMEQESIQEILTNDRHFEQEGFVALIKKLQ
jgi:predicted nucleic acid-binding protein